MMSAKEVAFGYIGTPSKAVHPTLTTARLHVGTEKRLREAAREGNGGG